MRGRTAKSMLKSIRTYDMSPSALARVFFQRNSRTVTVS